MPTRTSTPTETARRAPRPDDTKPYVLIVEARYYQDISDGLLAGAKAALDKAGAGHEVVQVPGALEIPAAIRIAVRSMDFVGLRRRFDGYVALGCVIKGGTYHFEVVANESARGLMHVAHEHTLAVGNGILTCYTQDQARERADPARGDKGGEAARACLAMIELKQLFGVFPR
ncbi:MAG: 6,7-dimethyl-8-ribityllumazine synthase [Alphaproteobacteria bacterium]|nr:6,7-dimethyl-8-ribityllumazine synthase [Alphaproteobacteria bacterium]